MDIQQISKLSLFQVLVPPVQVAKKTSRNLIHVKDAKEFKKLLRTHNNVLVIFAKSGECSIDILTKENCLQVKNFCSVKDLLFGMLLCSQYNHNVM